MRKTLPLLVWMAMLGTTYALSKPHVLSFGKPMPVKLFVGPAEDKVLPIKVRGFYVDGKLKEFTTGETHDVTDRMFVVRRAFRMNDSLPEEAQKAPQWRWQRGPWLLVDRSTGHVTQLKLPDFDPYYSIASWYRDYVAYCGISDDGEKAYAVVAQLGRKKPILRKDLGRASQADAPDSECASPNWSRQPVRVTFQPANGDKLNFTIRGHVADTVTSGPDEGSPEE